jgi:hypothetical protein
MMPTNRTIIKASEQIHRQRQMPIQNVFMKAEANFHSSEELHGMLGKPENKIRLQALLQKEFQREAETTRTEIVYCVVCSYSRNLTTGVNFYASVQKHTLPVHDVMSASVRLLQSRSRTRQRGH